MSEGAMASLSKLDTTHQPAGASRTTKIGDGDIQSSQRGQLNSPLMRETRAMCFVTRLINEKKICDGSLRRMKIHSISNDKPMTMLGAVSKFNADWGFLTKRCQAGGRSAEAWLAEHFDRLGKESTIDLQTTYL
jgi:hypothetical protein